jgi:hypothetical protein
MTEQVLVKSDLAFGLQMGYKKPLLASVLIWISHFWLFPLYQRFLDLKPTITPICPKHIPQQSSGDIRFSRIQDQSVGDQRPQSQLRL